MRRNIKNDKVLRAISIGLATMIAVTSAPVTVFADEGDGSSQEQQQTSPTADSVSAEAGDTAASAQEYTGKLRDNNSGASGTIGTKAQEALDDIANAKAAAEAGNKLAGVAGQHATGDQEAKGVIKNMDALLNEKDGPGNDGQGQVKDSEDTEKTAERDFGVVLDKDGSVIDRTGLDKKISDANTEIGNAEDAKSAANNALGKVSDAITTAEGKISDADEKKSDADKYTSVANTAINTKTKIDQQTQQKLDGIEIALKDAVVEDDINKAVSAAATASSKALQVAGEQIKIVGQAKKQAKDAADDAQNHSSSYTRQQMITLANQAKSAADIAKKAKEDTEKALETAQQKEAAAEKDVSNAKNALDKAQDDAVAVLKDYKDQIDAINKTITTANGYRAGAKEAMKQANNAIDVALELMENKTNQSPDDATKKVEAMNTAIKAANDAIANVTGLSTDGAKKKRKDTNTRVEIEAKNLSKAKEIYTKTIEVTGEIQDNKEAAVALLEELNGLIEGKDNLYDKWLRAVDGDINDLKALLSTSGNYTYKQLSDMVDKTQQEVDRQGGQLEEYVATAKPFGELEQPLTAEQIAEICKVDEDEEGNPVYTEMYKKLLDASQERKIIVEYKNGNDTLELNAADYVDSDGNIYKKKEGNPTPSLEDGYYKPGFYQNAWTKETKEISKKIEDGFLKVLTEVTYEHPVWTTDMEVAACENSCQISRTDYNRFDEMEEEEKQKLVITFLCEDKNQLNLGKVENIEISGNTATVTVKDPNMDHTNASLVYEFDCDIEIKFADPGMEQWIGIQLNYKLNEFKKQSSKRVGMFRETTGYGYTKYDRKETTGDYTEDALKVQEILQGLNTEVMEFNTAKIVKEGADENLRKANEFDPSKANDLTDDQKALYKSAVDASQTIADEKTKAQGYRDKVSQGLTGLNNTLAEAKDGVGAFEIADGLVKTAQTRLGVVLKKINKLDELKIEAEGKLASKKVDDATGNTTINAIFNSLNTTLKGFKKYKPNDYNPLDYVATNIMNLEVLSVDLLSESLAAAINTAAGILETAQTNLGKATKVRRDAETTLKGGYTYRDEKGNDQFITVEGFEEDNITYYSDMTQKEADRAANALAAWRAPSSDDDGDNGDNGDSTGDSSTGEISGFTLPSGITVLPLSAVGGDVGGTATGRGGRTTGGRDAEGGQDRGVAGVRVEDNNSVGTNKNNNNSDPVTLNGTSKDGKDRSGKELKKVETPAKPLAATPYNENGVNPGVAAAGLAAMLGVIGTVFYDFQRRKRAKADEMKKYKNE
ncbi:MAG: hypothetical protein K6D93_03695 [Saccharofermentans sp.]|nr:hypothetical protein [Saccharofermentans sp.]